MIPAHWLPPAPCAAFAGAGLGDRIDDLRRDLDPHAARRPACGATSADGSAIAGRDGWLYLHEGSNGWSDQAGGRARLSADGLALWQQVLDRRRRWFAGRGIRFAQLFVPEKACVYPEPHPDAEPPSRLRPVLQLVPPGSPADLHYPVEALRAGRTLAPTYHRTNSHWTWWGAYLAAAGLFDTFGLRIADAVPPVFETAVQHDLAVKFDGVPDETWRGVDGSVWRDYTNEAQIAGHQGRLSHFLNPSAPNACRVLIFGDSYTFDHGLAAWFAFHCREVLCLWQTGVSDALVAQTRPDIVVAEMAERFVARVPVDGLAGTVAA